MYNINISNTMHVLNWARSPKHCCFLKCIILSIYILLDIPKFFLRPLQVWDKEVWMYRYFQLVKLLWIIKKYLKWKEKYFLLQHFNTEVWIFVFLINLSLNIIWNDICWSQLHKHCFDILTGHQWLHVHPDWFDSTGDPCGAGSGLVSHLSTVPRVTEWVLLSDD